MDFIQKTPVSGSVAPMDRFTNVLLEMTKRKSTTITQSNMNAGVCCGFVRIYNDDFEGNKIDLQFDDEDDAMAIFSLQSSLHDVMKKARGVHPTRDYDMVRVARVKIRADVVDINYDDWGTTSLGSLVRSSGMKQGDVLEIASAVSIKSINAGSDISD